MQNELVVFGEVWNGWVLHLVCQDLFEDTNWFNLLAGKSNELELFEGQQAIEDDSRSTVGPLVVTEDLVKLSDEVVIVKSQVILGLTFNKVEKLVIFSSLINCLHHYSGIGFVFNGQFLI